MTSPVTHKDTVPAAAKQDSSRLGSGPLAEFSPFERTLSRWIDQCVASESLAHELGEFAIERAFGQVRQELERRIP
jgi:hypothetical protein